MKNSKNTIEDELTTKSKKIETIDELLAEK
jgi:hypothetical protein